jgi:hypothetical protein
MKDLGHLSEAFHSAGSGPGDAIGTQLLRYGSDARREVMCIT